MYRFAEDYPQVDIGMLKRAGFFLDGRRSMSNKFLGFKVTLTHEVGRKWIDATIVSADGAARSQRIGLCLSPLPFGERTYLLCPKTKTRCSKLYLVNGELASRVGHGLEHTSRFGGEDDRRRARIDRLTKRLHGQHGRGPARGVNRQAIVSELAEISEGVTLDPRTAKVVAHERKRLAEIDAQESSPPAGDTPGQEGVWVSEVSPMPSRQRARRKEPQSATNAKLDRAPQIRPVEVQTPQHSPAAIKPSAPPIARPAPRPEPVAAPMPPPKVQPDVDDDILYGEVSVDLSFVAAHNAGFERGAPISRGRVAALVNAQLDLLASGSFKSDTPPVRNSAPGVVEFTPSLCPEDLISTKISSGRPVWTGSLIWDQRVMGRTKVVVFGVDRRTGASRIIVGCFEDSPAGDEVWQLIRYSYVAGQPRFVCPITNAVTAKLYLRHNRFASAEAQKLISWRDARKMA